MESLSNFEIGVILALICIIIGMGVIVTLMVIHNGDIISELRKLMEINETVSKIYGNTSKIKDNTRRTFIPQITDKDKPLGAKDAILNRPNDDSNQIVSKASVIVFHSVDMFFIMPFFYKTCQSKLFKARNLTGVKTQLL